MATNTAASELGGCGSGGDGICGVLASNMGSLLLSLGFALILVGALFYYVRQRIEVLETSQKEQIHVMQSFIASIGDQFHRMNGYIQQKLGGSAPNGPGPAAAYPTHTNSNAKTGLIDISDDDAGLNIIDGSVTESDEYDSGSESDSSDDSGSESDSSGSDASRSSNTTRDSDTDRCRTTKQIRIHPDIPHPASTPNPNMDCIKVVEITDNQHQSQLDHAGDQDTRALSSSSSSSSESDDSNSETESESEPAPSDILTNDISELGEMGQEIHVIKTESDYKPEYPPQTPNQKKTMVLDLDLNIGDLEIESVSLDASGTVDADAGTGAGAGAADADASGYAAEQYSSLTIKQLRQLLKKKSPAIDVDVSKLKREQIIELLRKK